MKLISEQSKSFSYFAPGVIIAYGESIDAQPHQHALWQLCLPSEPRFANQPSYLNQQPLLSGQVIPPNVTHQLSMPRGWVILAEQESSLGKAISELPIPLSMPLSMVQGTPQLDSLLADLSEFPTLIETLKHNSYQCEDKRLLMLLDRLDACFSGDCLKPDQWRAKQVASWLAISESRFLHLVKQELGVAWRPYLLWRRLICSVQAIKSGKSMTEAAHLAGFSDSAHLSRTIKRIFGMTSKQLLNSF